MTTIKNDLGEDFEVVRICSCGLPLIAVCLNGIKVGEQHATYDDEDYHFDYWSTNKVIERANQN